MKLANRLLLSLLLRHNYLHVINIYAIVVAETSSRLEDVTYTNGEVNASNDERCEVHIEAHK
jgi:hypothetical protein